MKMTHWNKILSISAMFVAIPLFAAVETREAWAWRSPPPGYWASPRYRTLPGDFRVIRYENDSFYFFSGRYYRRAPSGFYLIAPPIGVVVPFLPIGYVSFVVGGITYYDLNGVYYTRIPEGYRVVEYPLAVERKEIVAAPEKVHRIIVQTDLLKVRSGPGKDHNVISQVERGKELKVLGNIPEWYYVELDDGGRGWVMMKFVVPVTPKPEPQG